MNYNMAKHFLEEVTLKDFLGYFARIKCLMVLEQGTKI